MSAIIYILLVIVGGLLIWDIRILSKISKNADGGNSKLNDEKYFDLKYQIKLLQSIAAILIFGATFFGYSTFKGIEDKFQEKLENLEKQTDTLENKVKKYNETVRYNPRIFVVNNVKFQSDITTRKADTIYFKDLNDSFGKKLPLFEKSPLLNVQGRAVDLNVIEVTSQYFVVSQTSYRLNSENKYDSFDIWIASFD
ncbi:MAG TPA: hypothetical protein ENH60_11530 [Pricia sp.]|uniref:Uncharacterized protein n=2 Tax=root TaxID=1 RepID=A0A831QMD1_9FLAO|nr:hypothetical protein [Pricia sp.]HEA19628.1 hypothetical protein [Pricia antarctica]